MQLSAVFVPTFAFNPPEMGHRLMWGQHFNVKANAISRTNAQLPVPKA
jgi:hypothetical protein